MRKQKDRLTPIEALDEIRRLLDREMRWRRNMWKDSATAHEYYTVRLIRQTFKSILKKVTEADDAVGSTK